MFARTVSRKGLALAGTVALAVSLAACADPILSGGEAVGSVEDMEPITLSVRSDGPEASGQALIAFAEEITERTNGKVSFDFYWSSSLLTPEETLTGAGDGVVHITQLVANYFPQELPISNWQMSLASGVSRSYPHGLVQGTAVSHEIFTSDPVRQELLDHNVVPLTATNTSTGRSLICADPWQGLENSRGLRVRTGNINAAEIEALGMTPVHVSTPEVYQALSRGIVDCAEYPAVTLKVLSLWEVAPHVVPVRLTPLAAYPLVINKTAWDSFPEDVKTIVQEAAVNYMVASTKKTMADLRDVAQTGVSEHDVQFYDPADVDRELAAFQAQRINGMPGSAPPSLDDAPEFIDRYRDLLDEWLRVQTEELDMPLNQRTPDALTAAYESGPEAPLDEFGVLFKERVVGDEQEVGRK